MSLSVSESGSACSAAANAVGKAVHETVVRVNSVVLNHGLPEGGAGWPSGRLEVASLSRRSSPRPGRKILLASPLSALDDGLHSGRLPFGRSAGKQAPRAGAVAHSAAQRSGLARVE